MSEIKNATIKSTMLGIESHGILTCMLYLDYGGACQSFGGYAFDSWSQPLGKRVGTAYGMQFLQRILEVVGVDKWEALQGKHIRVDAERSEIRGIGNIIADKWFYPERDLKVDK